MTVRFPGSWLPRLPALLLCMPRACRIRPKKGQQVFTPCQDLVQPARPARDLDARQTRGQPGKGRLHQGPGQRQDSLLPRAAAAKRDENVKNAKTGGPGE